MAKVKKTASRTSPLKKTVRKSAMTKSRSDSSEIFDNEMPLSANMSKKSQNTGLRIFLGLIVLLVIVGLVAYYKRGLIFAARVNNSFITRWTLDRRLESQYGASVVDQMISEQLIFEEAKKKQIKVTTAEVDAKISEITKQLGEQVDIKDLLAQQGMTMADLRRQIEVQLLVEKLTIGLVNVSDQEISEYIEKNQSTMTATDEASIRQEALDSLAAQKKSEAVQKWFTDLKSRSRVVNYL